MENKLTVKRENSPNIRHESNEVDSGQPRCYPAYTAYNAERRGKFVDEVIGSVKDSRMNTKRAISAEIAAMARVQNQNDRLITICEQELRRKDLSPERRYELIGTISRATESSAYEGAQSREFQREQLDREYKLTCWKIGGLILLFIGGIGRAIWINSRA